MAALGLYVNNVGTPTAGDAALRNHLISFGHTVTYVDDAVTPTLAQGFDGYVISETCTGSIDSAAFAALALPWLSCDIGSFDDMLMTSVANGANLGSSRFFDLSTHAITAGLPLSNLQVRTANVGFWGTPGGAANLAAGAEVFAVHTDDATETMGFAVDAGGTLVGGGTAPARRVCIAYIDSFVDNGAGGVLTADGITLLDQAVDWTLSGAVEPAEGSASGSVTWAGSAAGSAPAVAAAEGSATGSVTWTGMATGTVEHCGEASGAVAWAGTAAGHAVAVGTASGGVDWVGTASGSTAHAGIATGAINWLGIALGDADLPGIDISVTIGPTRISTAAVGITRTGTAAIDSTRAGTITAGPTRTGSNGIAIVASTTRVGSLSTTDTRIGSADVDDTRIGGLTAADTRVEREA